MVTRAYMKEKLRKAKSAIEDAEKALARMPDAESEPTFIRIPYDCELDVNTRFAIQQLNAVQINVDERGDK